MNVRLAMSLLLGREASHDHSLRRYASILQGGATAILAKIVAVAGGLVTVPFTLHHLGAERYGLWATLFSILSWLSLADLGLSNGLISALSEAFAQERSDLAREYVSTAFWGLLAMAAVLALVLVAAYPLIDWAHVMRIGSPGVAAEFRAAAALATALFLLNLPFTVVSRIFVAAQRSAMANFWAIANSLAMLTGLLTAIAARGSLPALVMGYFGAQLLVSVASAVWLFTRVRPELSPTRRISRSSLGKVFGVAASFFISQLATLLLFQSANVLISHKLGPSYVASYQITWLLFQYVTLPQQLIGANIWAAIGEAYAKGDIGWIRTLFRRYSLLGLATGGPFILTLTVVVRPAVRWWAGPHAVPDQELVLWMAAWACVLMVLQPIIAVLAGTARLRAYSMMSLLGAGAAVVAADLTLTTFGPSAVMASYVLCFGTAVLLPACLQVRNVLRIPGADTPRQCVLQPRGS